MVPVPELRRQAVVLAKFLSPGVSLAITGACCGYSFALCHTWWLPPTSGPSGHELLGLGSRTLFFMSQQIALVHAEILLANIHPEI